MQPILGFINPAIMVLFIPIIAIVMVFGTGMFSIYFKYRQRKEMFAMYHQQRMAAIEKGIELPPLPEDSLQEHDLFKHAFAGQCRDNRGAWRSPHRSLMGGLVLLFIGLTVYLSLHFTGIRTDAGGDVGLFGLIPAGIGVARLIYYFAVGRKLADAMEEERKARLAEAARMQNKPV
jgi:hypothetical protein